MTPVFSFSAVPQQQGRRCGETTKPVVDGGNKPIDTAPLFVCLCRWLSSKCGGSLLQLPISKYPYIESVEDGLLGTWPSRHDDHDGVVFG